MKIETRFQNILKPDYYEIFPIYSDEELENRLLDYPFHIATLLNLKTIRSIKNKKFARKKLIEFLSLDFDIQRKLLCEILESRDISRNIIVAFSKIRREDFVPQKFRRYSYLDISIPFSKNCVISTPHIISIMVESFLKFKAEKILEIGVGSGYHASILIESMNRKCNYTGVEINQAFLDFGKENLKRLDFTNITVLNNSEFNIKLNKMKFDGVFTASAMDTIPSHLHEILVEESIFQGSRPLSPDEFNRETSTSWVKSKYKCYLDYFSGNWMQEFACLSTWKKKNKEFELINTIYDVRFVPYKKASNTNVFYF